MKDVTPMDILLVEDNATDAELCIDALSQHLVNDIKWVKDGAEALDALFPATDADAPALPKLILLDLQLPKVTGLEVLRRIKSDPNTRKIPVVVLTSSKEERDIVEAYDSGVNSFVSKPVRFENFSQVTEQLGCYWLLVNRTPE